MSFISVWTLTLALRVRWRRCGASREPVRRRLVHRWCRPTSLSAPPCRP